MRLRLHILFFLGLLAIAVSPMQAQSCAWPGILPAQSRPVVLDLVSGAAQPVQPVMDQPNLLLQGDWSGAYRSYLAADSAEGSARCAAQFYRLVAGYMDAYAQDGPLFPWFNGGFYTYLRDSLYWGLGKMDTTEYTGALHGMADLVALTKGENVVFLELFGDLLTQHPEKFVRNYMSCLAYLRAAMLSDSSAGADFERKAYYAVEAPRTAYHRFDKYQFTQLKKALRADMDAELTAAEAEGSGLTYLTAQSGGRLGPMLRKASDQVAAKEGKTGPRFEEVNMDTVRADTDFNKYAIFVILVLLGAVAFIWIQIRRGNRRAA